MTRSPPETTPVDTRFPSTTLFRSQERTQPARRLVKHDAPRLTCGANEQVTTFHAFPWREPQEQEPIGWQAGGGERDGHSGRSEEHTSELQSLLRISYAVFCLKTKTIQVIVNNRSNDGREIVG